MPEENGNSVELDQGENGPAGEGTSHSGVPLEDAVADDDLPDSLRELDEQWQPVRVSFDDVYEREGLPGIESGEISLQKAARPVVARFITRALIILFVAQMALVTLIYLGLVVSGAIFGGETMEATTQAVIRAVEAIVPVTTTLLGVVIGYYFREKEEAVGADNADALEEG